jgi:hypothetical protein
MGASPLASDTGCARSGAAALAATYRAAAFFKLSPMAGSCSIPAVERRVDALPWSPRASALATTIKARLRVARRGRFVQPSYGRGKRPEPGSMSDEPGKSRTDSQVAEQ